MQRLKQFLPVYILAASAVVWPQTTDLVAVISKPVARTIELPGELQSFQNVSLRAKVRGYVERVLVDRGSVVKSGQILIELSAPEMTAQIAEAESKAQAAKADRLQADAQLAAAESTYERLKKAAQTPGAIAGNEIVLAQKQVELERSLVESKQQASQAAAAALRAQKDLQAYLRITAPFDGVVTDRLVHPGALAGPSGDPVLLVLREVSRLRLVVAVPEEDSGAIVRGARVEFRVPAYPERKYFGTIARIAHALDRTTRTMAVELDVANSGGSLSPGMYPSVQWPVRAMRPGFFVPRTSVVTTTERTFVIRDREGRAEWVTVTQGAVEGDLVQVFGNLRGGDRIVRRATDEIREGSFMSPPK